LGVDGSMQVGACDCAAALPATMAPIVDNNNDSLSILPPSDREPWNHSTGKRGVPAHDQARAFRNTVYAGRCPNGIRLLRFKVASTTLDCMSRTLGTRMSFFSTTLLNASRSLP
jgi:hypothetical protein